VLLCLPTAPGLPLRRTETSVHRPIFEQLSDKPLLACDSLYGVSEVKEQWRVENLRADVRNCTRDEGRSFEAGSQVQASNRCKLLSSKAMVVSVAANVGTDHPTPYANDFSAIQVRG
jgi:hypothetical protein